MTKHRDVHINGENSTGRRRFLNRLWAVLAALACLEFGWLSIRLVRSAGQKGSAQTREDLVRVGRVEDFMPSTVTPIPQGQFFLVCLEDGSFLALSRLCTHLGCATSWDQEAGRFICPCHGSSFDITGMVLTPPAVKGLSSHPLRIEDGLILVNRAVSEPAPSSGRGGSSRGVGA